MTIQMSDDGTISIFQGDSGEITIDGLNPDYNYYVYFAIRDEDGALIGDEINVTSNNRESVTILLSPSFTNQLTVPAGESYQVYYYGVKLTPAGGIEENTVLPEMGGQLPFIVYRKVVEGVING